MEVTANVTSSTSVSLSWSPPALNQRNGIIRHYFISLQSGEIVVTKNISASVTEVNLAGLQPFSTYNCTIQAETVRLGPVSTVVQVTTPEDGKKSENEN